MRPTWAEINLKSIENNFYEVKKLITNSVKVMAVVKADAYGNGSVKVSRKLIECGADMLGVATVEEALELRHSGIECDIILLSGIQIDEAVTVVRNNLTPACFLPETFKALSDSAVKLNRWVNVHLKIDTGMTRLGINNEDVKNFLSSISIKNINIEGVFTHLSCADNNNEYTLHQIDIFNNTLEALRKLNLNCKYIHAANSAAVQVHPYAHYNLVRPGIMLYGSGKISDVNTMPVMKLKSKIVQTRKVGKDIPVSYGGTCVTDKDSILAVLPIGYADGYSRKLSNIAKVSVNGNLAPVVGRVCMDLIIIDITGLKDVKVGDEVTLFGDDLVSIEDISNWSETISYEVMSLIGKRVPRVYK